MGPTVLFDKSFLQSLSLNEAVWFDHFFITNLCPILFSETLVDLGKTYQKSKTPDKQVKIISQKFPEVNGYPCSHHIDLAYSDLLGNNVPMTGQIPLGDFRYIERWSSWRNGEFSYEEWLYAYLSRYKLGRVNLLDMDKKFDYWNDFKNPCASLEAARDMAVEFINSKKAPFLRLELSLLILQVPQEKERIIQSRWAKLGYPSIIDFAPYAAFMISVILFFQLSNRSGLLSSRRVSNLSDIVYLFYLPFSMVFISSDKLQKRVSELFLRSDQESVWGPDLKKSLKELNLFFSLYPDSDKEKGLWLLAPCPPITISSLVASLWDRHVPRWREKYSKEPYLKLEVTPEDIREKINKMKATSESKTTSAGVKFFGNNGVLINRRVRMKRGDWYQVPKESVK